MAAAPPKKAKPVRSAAARVRRKHAAAQKAAGKEQPSAPLAKDRRGRSSDGRKPGGKGGKGGKGGGRGRGRGRGGSGGGQSRGQNEKPRRPLADLLDYARNCAKTVDSGLSSAEDEELMASRAVEEIGDRVLLIAADQRGSRPLERLLRRAGVEAFSEAFGRLVEALPELAPNQYASHVLESALASWTERHGASDPSRRPPVAPLAAACKTLSQESGWSALMGDACASHTLRALLLALGGFVPEAQGKGKALARAGLLPERKFEMPQEAVDCRQNVARAFVKLSREDPSLCLSPNGSAVVQLLLRVLRDRGDRALVAEAAAAVTGAEGSSRAPSAERCEELLHSAAGSRALEAVLETCSAEAASKLFSGFFRPRLRALVAGEAGDFGAFLAQRVADSLREEPQLQLALAEVDFAVCLGADATGPQQAVAAKFIEACLRLRACLKQGATAIFKALGLHVSSEYKSAWPTLLSLEQGASPKDLLRGSGSSQKGRNVDPTALRNLPTAGPQLLGLLLRFPAEVVQPLNSGLPAMLDHPEVFGALAREARTARVLEAALAPSSALLPKLRTKLCRTFKGLLGGLGPHPVGGWVCAAVWRASLGDQTLRQAFADELLAVEDDLRARNFAVWKVCGLNQAKTKQEEWTQLQQKAGKAKRLFDELLEGGDPEAAKAAAQARARAAEDAAAREALADPLVAGLLVDEGGADAGPAAPTAEMAGGEVEEAEPPEEGEADAEMDALFGKRRGRGKRRKTATVDEAKAASLTSAAPRDGGDADLKEALELIAGKAPKRVKKRRRVAAGGASGAAAKKDSDDDDDDGE